MEFDNLSRIHIQKSLTKPSDQMDEALAAIKKELQEPVTFKHADRFVNFDTN